MQKLVIDSNVLVSSLIGKSFPFKILDELVLLQKVVCILTEPIWEEYLDVLGRPKFDRFPDFRKDAEIILTRLDEIGEYHVPTRQIALLKDADDDIFLEAAVAAHADFIITGNSRDFTISQINGTRIVTPKEYWEQSRP